MNYGDWLQAAKIERAEDLYQYPHYEPFPISAFVNESEVQRLPSQLGIHKEAFAAGANVANANENEILELLKLGASSLFFKNKLDLCSFDKIDFSILRSFFNKDSWDSKLLKKYSNIHDKIFFLPFETKLEDDKVSLGFSSEEVILAGANKSLELVYILKSLKRAFDEGFKNVEALHFVFYNDDDFFLDIAKIRAFRFLYQALLNEYGIKHSAPYIHIEAHPCFYQVCEPTNNIFRLSSTIFSAQIGNCQSFSAFDYAYRQQSDSKSRRLLITSQWLLQEESHLNEVLDASNGSYFIEDLTYKLAEYTWTKLLDEDFDVLQRAKQIQEQRYEDIKEGKKILLGTNFMANESHPSDGAFWDAAVKK